MPTSFRVQTALALAVLLAGASLLRADSRQLFNDNWRFSMGDADGKPLTATTRPGDWLRAAGYEQLKPWMLATGNDLVSPENAAPQPDGVAPTFPPAAPGFDDSSWRTLNLPHDWAVEKGFDINLPGNTGKLPFAGIGWYRKKFTPPAGAKHVFLDVDGAMSYSAVYVNGTLVGGWPYGYASWRVDLTPALQPGKENTLAIRLANPDDSSRWYPGAGIYRNVWLVTAGDIHVAHWGVFVTTPQITPERASVSVAVDLENQSASDAAPSVAIELFEADRDGRSTGAALATAQADSVAIPAHGHAKLNPTISLTNPKLWSTASPNRYVAVTTIKAGDKILDTHETPFGVRSIAFDPEKGFILNGQRLTLQGVCNHHDLGALGSALNFRALERQIEILKEMGCNAIRTSHNPPALELLDLCDREGLVVMDEAFDTWTRHKRPNDYQLLFHDWRERDLHAQVRRDRNHPCVILWSIGNEIADQNLPGGPQTAAELGKMVKDEDPTRFITAACNYPQAAFNDFHKSLDVYGFNYKPDLYDKFRQTNPTQPLFGSETASTISSRGEYFFPLPTSKSGGLSGWHVSSYDLSAPRWAWPPDVEWVGLDKVPAAAGEFVWTGFDYLGEPTPYNADSTNALNFSDPAERAKAEAELKEQGKIKTPARSSYFGIVDLAGFKKDRFFLYQSRWRPDLPMAHILPHWTWPERVGQVTPVFVYTSGDEGELFLNGKSLGRKKKTDLDYRLRWDDVTYQPGELRVVTYKEGKQWATDTVATAGEPATLEATPDRKEIAADDKDLSFITVRILDKDGHLVPRDKRRLHFHLDGPGELVATDNGDPTDLEKFHQDSRLAFNGMALAIVRGHGSGTLTLKVTADSVKDASTTLTLK